MTDTEQGTGATQPGEQDTAEVTTPETEAGTVEDDSQAQTYPAEVVRKLRDENAKARTRAKDAETRADELATRLHAELVRATGLLADPSDLPFDAEHLADADKLAAAIDTLINAKPHLKARKVTGDVGQGNRGDHTAEFSLLDKLKRNA